MADDRDDDEQFDKGQEKQSIGGQQSHESEYGQQGDQTSGAEGQPIGGNDNETGSVGGASGQQGDGFILQQGQDAEDQQQDDGSSSAETTGGTDFAEQGRGAAEDEEDEEGAGPQDVGSGGPGSSI